MLTLSLDRKDIRITMRLAGFSTKESMKNGATLTEKVMGPVVVALMIAAKRMYGFP